MCGGALGVVETLDQQGEGRCHVRQLGGQGLVVLLIVVVVAADLVLLLLL